MSNDDARKDLAERARFLGSLTDIGVPWSPEAVAPDEQMPRAEGAVAGPTRGAADPKAALAAIREDLGDCQRCRLAGGRKNIVFGQGICSRCRATFPTVFNC